MLASLKEIFRSERERTVPAHVGFLRYLGGLALVFFLLEAATGILLMIYYRPSAGAAYHSIGVITDAVRFGWLIRSVHRWGSDLLIILVVVHLFRVYFSSAYQAPRELSWWLGILLLVLVLTLGFTGTLLPWDQYAYWYIDSARATISGIPVLGSAVLGLIWGGWEIGEEVLLRFYALHVGALPWLVVALLFLHVLMAWRLGLKAPAAQSEGVHSVGTPFFPDFLAEFLTVVLLATGVLLSLAVCLPPVLLQQADPVSPLAHTQPRWYFLPVRELLRDLPGGIATIVVIAFLALLFLTPVIDRVPARPGSKRLLQRALGLVTIAAWVFLGVRGYLR